MADNVPENKNIGGVSERIAPIHKSEESFERFDSTGARENLDMAGKPKEFKESISATVQSAASVSAGASSDDNDHLNKFFSEIDREKLEKIQELINVVFEKSPEEGIAAAKKLNDPYLMDELQKVLTTEWMHKELVKRGLLADSK